METFCDCERENKMVAELKTGSGKIFSSVPVEILLELLLKNSLQAIFTVSPFEVLLPQLFVTLHLYIPAAFAI